jgi:ABC-type uncharacterized transport system fused permease/ATPase subunit
LAYFLLAVPIFNHSFDNKTKDELSAIILSYSFKCQYLIYLFTRLYGSLGDVSSIIGNAERVYQLYDQLQLINSEFNKIECNETTMNENSITESDEEICFVVKDLTIMIPGQPDETLIRQLSFRFQKNENVLLTGQSGCGKTSLFRCITGLWKCYTGSIVINPNQRYFILPQNSYFTTGSLIEQIIYPTEMTDHIMINNMEIMGKNITEWLSILKLEHLLARVQFDYNLVPSFTWSNILSMGNLNKINNYYFR